MKLMVIVLAQVDALETLLSGLANAGIHGATILDSTGMARALSHSGESFSFLGSLRAILDPDREVSKTIFTVMKDDQIEAAKKVIYDVLGDLKSPDSGIFFVLPVDFVEGIPE